MDLPLVFILRKYILIFLSYIFVGPKPSDLYGKHTWKIEKFSQLNKRELRSNAFEVGGYKWYVDEDIYGIKIISLLKCLTFCDFLVCMSCAFFPMVQANIFSSLCLRGDCYPLMSGIIFYSGMK